MYKEVCKSQHYQQMISMRRNRFKKDSVRLCGQSSVLISTQDACVTPEVEAVGKI